VKWLLVVVALALPPLPVIPLGLDLYLPVPEDNPLNRDKVTLGRQLFRDSILSRDRTLSCSSCHDPSRAFTDGRPVAIGANDRRGTRSAPTLINRVYGHSQFWDGRARTLEQQVAEPIANPNELDFSIADAVDRLGRSRGYRARFVAVFGRPPDAESLTRALASYVRTILAGNSPYDRFVNGDTTALLPEQRRGLALFRGKAGCTNCHWPDTDR